MRRLKTENRRQINALRIPDGLFDPGRDASLLPGSFVFICEIVD
jgi:hypothetical protein